jgi:hypothetical protein
MKKIILLLVLLIPFFAHAQFNGFAFKPFVASTDVAPSWTPGTTANDGILAVNTSTRETWYYDGSSWTEFTFSAGSGTAIATGRVAYGNVDSTGITGDTNFIRSGDFLTINQSDNSNSWSVGDDNQTMSGYGSGNGPSVSYSLFRAQGTRLAPTSILNGDRIGAIIARGYTSTAASPGSRQSVFVDFLSAGLNSSDYPKGTFSIACRGEGENDEFSAGTPELFISEEGEFKLAKYTNSRNDYSTLAPGRIIYPDATGFFKVSLPDSLQVINPATNSGLITLRTALRSLQTTGATAFIDGGNSFGGATVLGTNDANTLEFETNDTVAMTINTAQEVGIGITPTAGIKLRVAGASQIDGQVKVRGTGNTFATSTASEVAFFNTTSSGSSGLLFNNSDELELYGNLGTTVQKWNSTSTTFAGAVQVKTIKYTAAGTTAVSTTDYYIRIDAALGAQTYTLPTPTSGRILKFKRLDSNPETVITFTGTVDGAVNPVTTGGGTISALSTQYGALTLIANGTDWDIAD